MDNSDKIAKLQAEIVQLQAEQEAFDSLSPDHKFAIELHDTLCKMEHTESCGWFYEFTNGVDNWNGWTHQEYLGKAKKIRQLLPGFTDAGIISVLRAIGQI